MKGYLKVAIVTLILVSATATPAIAQELGDPANGKTIFQTNCAACHGSDGSGSIPGTPDMTDSATWEQISKSQHLESVRNGVPDTQMPAFEGQLSEQEIKDVVAYERSLAEEGGPSGGSGESGTGEAGGESGSEEAGSGESTGAETPSPAVTPVNENVPGFTALTAVSGLLAALGAVLVTRRRR